MHFFIMYLHLILRKNGKIGGQCLPGANEDFFSFLFFLKNCCVHLCTYLLLNALAGIFHLVHVFLTLKSLLFVAFLSENEIIGPKQPHTASKVVHHGHITMHILVMFTLLVKENKA